VLQVVRNGRLRVSTADSQTLTFASEDLASRQWVTGDYFCRWQNHEPRPITGSTADAIVLGPDPAWSRQPAAGEIVEIMVRLQQPYVDPRYCIGCGVCEHECPVYSHRAIQVTAENESRNLNQKLVL
jgi:NAD-dependent dihydropyrimidine dehydrogenase PreA subunit